jgi:hypothetical protein
MDNNAALIWSYLINNAGGATSINIAGVLVGSDGYIYATFDKHTTA